MAYEIELEERAAFVDRIGRALAAGGALAGFFDEQAPLAVARAPGRLDVLGGIADYSGSLVLELPIRQAAFAAVQLHPEPQLRLVSIGAGATPLRSASVPASLLGAEYAVARAFFRERPGDGWAAYLAGAACVLAREHGFRPAGGVRLWLESDVPEGRGLASSAAVLVASMLSLAAAAGIELAPETAALSCQKAENLVVGAPSGVMDPMTSACGRSGRLLELLCQPASLGRNLPVPPDLRFFAVDSGPRHASSGTSYGVVRAAAFMGYRILAEVLGLRVASGREPGHLEIEDPRLRGYLANLTPLELDRDLLEHLPERLSGASFLERYGGTTDPVLRVDPARAYPVRAATAHPIREHWRVATFGELLGGASHEQTRARLGELMYESHASYVACGLGSPATDRLVALVRERGPAEGLYGARVTGGGSGGAVAVLAEAGAESAVRAVAERHAARGGCEARVSSGSSAGAAELGVRVLPPRAAGSFGAPWSGAEDLLSEGPSQRLTSPP